jgi:antirestriction protein
MKNREIEVTFNYVYNGETNEIEFTLTGSESESDVKEAIILIIQDKVKTEGLEEREVTEEDVILTDVTCSENIHEKYLNIEKIFDYAEIYSECEQDFNVVNAAIGCGIDGSNIDEAYSGSYKSDEDFAEDTAEQLGLIDRNAAWPQNCIDWEQAARSLMCDYSESNGNYFRRF